MSNARARLHIVMELVEDIGIDLQRASVDEIVNRTKLIENDIKVRGRRGHVCVDDARPSVDYEERDPQAAARAEQYDGPHQGQPGKDQAEQAAAVSGGERGRGGRGGTTDAYVDAECISCWR